MKAIALISGGLDSLLAARLIQEQGIEVIPLYFKIPFCQGGKKNLSGKKEGLKERLAVSGLKLEVVDISNEFLGLIINPRHGFGSHMNPCIDCKILMLNKARELLAGFRASFIVTGEVLGQRPMSQHRQALELIEKGSGLEGLLVRPLSAKLLGETIPEKEGWLVRAKLMDFNGRSRRPQIELAAALEIKDYPNAAGGCLLTDPEFSGRLKELIAHRELNVANLELLKFGRHFRLAPEAKLIVGRDERENNLIMDMAQEGNYLFQPSQDLAGPTSLGAGIFNEEIIKLACGIICRYCDLNGRRSTRISYRKIPEREDRSFESGVIDNNRLKGLRI